MTPFLGLSDLLEQARNNPNYGGTVQAANDLLPLQGAMGLTMEIGPALDWVFTNVTTGPNSPLWGFMGAGGVGGGSSLGPLPEEAETLFQDLARIPEESDSLEGPIRVFRPMLPGEDPIDYGNLMHQEGFPKYLELKYPNVRYRLNVLSGQTGPDVENMESLFDPTSGLNMDYGELKPILWNQSKLQLQIEGWGSEINRTRLFFYDRQGYIYEGVADAPLY